MHLAIVESSAIAELHLSVTPRRGESLAAFARRVAQELTSRHATVVRQLAFGPVRSHRPVIEALRQALDNPSLPMTWVEGGSCSDGFLAGLQIHAVVGTPVQTLFRHGRPLGRVWRDAAATHCVLDGLGSTDRWAGRTEQARNTFVQMETGLAQAGLGLSDLARTWFFLDDLLAWYGDFNRVRNECFTGSGLLPARVPASTGVGARNPAGAAVAAVAWAVRPDDPVARVVQFVPSPLQCPAPAYGSAFSRAVEIQSPGFRQLLVSGTASIAPDGHTVHAGDASAQIGLSMDVVAAILESRGMSFADVSRATAYFKSPADAPVLADWLAVHGWHNLPVVCACCAICRDELRFEIELDAIQAGP